ncbi:multidrug resistance-associated protein 5-like [Amphibalanus amphitrite]|uniref:multidrug resistance-associated protein 5-like n=1 Tax=Amphibalanus amphitrite TaxID=1232801 RepID=UPI001C90B995|nr:multidrug resistance-associated protein 5-like [Amphibalanus amphitrite]XP_043227097.1 multidrug resistance-associated protein 5-like [Amphibalanus amphitrite]
MTAELQEYTKRKWSERYKSSLKQLKPIRSKSKEPKHLMPGPGRGFLSLYTLSWMTGLMWKACRGQLKPDDIWTLRTEDSCQTNYTRLERHWRQEVANKGPRYASLTRTLIRTFRTRIVTTTVLLLVSNFLALLGPSILLRQVMLYLNSGSEPVEKAILLVVAMAVARIFSVYFMSAAFGVTCVFTGARASGALQLMVYHKVLRLGSASEQILGKVVNICTNDMERVIEGFRIFAFVISAFFMTGYGFVVNLLYVGPWSLLGFSMVIGSFFILGSIGGANSVLRMEVVKVTDKRVTFMSEILAAIRLIKTYAWEDRFKAQIDKIRNEEMRIIRKTTFLQSISNVLVPIIPVLATATSVIGYILSGNELNAAEAFTMFSVFNGLQMAIGTLPYGIRMLTETHVVLRRIQRMLLMKDVDMVTAHCDSGSAIEIEKATLAWEKPVLEKEKSDKPKREQSSKSLSRDMSAPQLPSIPVTNRLRSLSSRRHARDADKALDAEAATVINVVLTDVQLTVPRGRLLGVAGAVGSGKSSLVAAITGQLQVLCGSVRRAGSLAVVPQRAWIFNGTVRENIVFGRPFVADRYWRTVTVCALQSDLDLMENGDLSEIGERGVNLSGGQKQRVNLARAVYSDADIYLLDDPLSAVDTKVGQHIFQQCVCGELKDKTVVLVSHGVQYLSHCDEVVYMRDCKLAERGTHDQLMELQGGYYQLVSCDAASQQQEHQKKPETDKKAQEVAAPEDTGGTGGKFTSEETFISTAGIFKNFFMFYKLCGLCGMVLLSLLLLMYGSCRTGSAVYLQYWIDAGDGLMEERIKNMTLYNVTYDPGELAGAINDSPHVDYYILGYAGVTLLLILIGLIRTVLHNVCVVRGARRLHNKMIDSLVRCKMSFFDSTPSGRIINRLSKDMDTVDNRIPEFFEFIGQRFLIVLTQLMVPMIAYPYFALIVGVIFVLYAVMWRSLVAGVRSTKQVENVARSPLLHHLSSTVGGLAVIRAYGKENMMIERFVGLLDRHSSSLMTFRMSNSWFTLRADELGVAMLAVIGSVVLLVPGASAAEAGLILSLVYDTILIMPFLVMMCSELAAFLSAVDRCTEYCQDLDYEPPAEMPGDEKREGRWPSQGAIRLEGVSLRYRPDLPRVLHDLSLNVPAGEKVGIVGRTGAGKSTLISTLLRLMDLEEGRVLIDGVDISEVGLRQLRSNIAVIPQDPVLFTGTIRQNLDPFDQSSDAQVWSALERSGLRSKVSQLPLQLATPLTPDADTFSVGERQLVCLARALLRHARVLLLDEATASVDVQTDFFIQRTIREDFHDSTVITIAHRLNTVLEYGMIVVMQDGRIAELGSPAELADRADSQFRQMLRQAGITSVTKSPALPPLARQDTESDLNHTPGSTRVKFDFGDDVTTPNGDSRAETPGSCGDDEVLIAKGDSDGKGYYNEVTHL